MAEDEEPRPTLKKKAKQALKHQMFMERKILFFHYIAPCACVPLHPVTSGHPASRN